MVLLGWCSRAEAGVNEIRHGTSGVTVPLAISQTPDIVSSSQFRPFWVCPTPSPHGYSTHCFADLSGRRCVDCGPGSSGGRGQCVDACSQCALGGDGRGHAMSLFHRVEFIGVEQLYIGFASVLFASAFRVLAVTSGNRVILDVRGDDDPKYVSHRCP